MEEKKNENATKQDEAIALTISKEKDRFVYEFLKKYENEDKRMEALKKAVDLFQRLGCDNDDREQGFSAPAYKKEKYAKMDSEALLHEKEKLIEDILEYSGYVKDDCMEFGIIWDFDEPWWWIGEGSTLGYLALCGQYVKKIDEVLKEREGK